MMPVFQLRWLDFRFEMAESLAHLHRKYLRILEEEHLLQTIDHSLVGGH